MQREIKSGRESFVLRGFSGQEEQCVTMPIKPEYQWGHSGEKSGCAPSPQCITTVCWNTCAVGFNLTLFPRVDHIKML